LASIPSRTFSFASLKDKSSPIISNMLVSTTTFSAVLTCSSEPVIGLAGLQRVLHGRGGHDVALGHLGGGIKCEILRKKTMNWIAKEKSKPVHHTYQEDDQSGQWWWRLCLSPPQGTLHWELSLNHPLEGTSWLAGTGFLEENQCLYLISQALNAVAEAHFQPQVFLHPLKHHSLVLPELSHLIHNLKLHIFLWLPLHQPSLYFLVSCAL
jgi:hypothetical protein